MGMTVTTPVAGNKLKGTWTADVAARVNEMEDPYAFRLSNSTTSLSTATDGRVTFTTLVSSSGVTVSSNNRVTLNKAGRWHISLGLRYPAGGTANREHICAVRRYNASNVLQEIAANGYGSSSTGVCSCSVSRTLIVASTDYVEAWGYQDSGGSKTIDNGPTVTYGWTHFEGYWVGTS